MVDRNVLPIGLYWSPSSDEEVDREPQVVDCGEGESRWSLGEGEWKCLDIQAGRSCSVTRRASTSRLGWIGPCTMEVGSER